MSKNSLFALLLFAVFFSGCSSKYSTTPSSYTTTSYENQSTTKLQAVHRATLKPYSVFGVRYTPHLIKKGEQMEGVASWYGPDFHGGKTSSGEIYDMHSLTAAHKTWPMHTVVKVHNLENSKSVIVRINDRGPFVKNRIIDLSYAAGRRIGMHKNGTAKVRVTVLRTDGGNWPKTAKYGTSTGSTAADSTTFGSKALEKSDAKAMYYVQVASFSSLEAAVNFQQEHMKLPLSIGSKVEEKNGLYKVYVGTFKNEGKARKFMQNAKFDGAFLVREQR
ncbi:MAG: septal ring lytic transglycosylase RlpA family protein [Campylobacterota bacterium]